MGLSSVEIIWAILGVAAVVFATRNAFVFMPRHWQPRGALERALRHVPIAALAGLTTPAALAVLRSSAPDLALVLTDARLPASIVTLAVACWRRSALAGMLAGGTVFILLLMFGPEWVAHPIFQGVGHVR
jgi:branched-subunit amino acid transport protein